MKSRLSLRPTRHFASPQPDPARQRLQLQPVELVEGERAEQLDAALEEESHLPELPVNLRVRAFGERRVGSVSVYTSTEPL